MKDIAEAVIRTPWWVFPLLGYLLVAGLKSRRTRIVSIHRLFVIPVIFLAMSLNTLISAKPNDQVIVCWLAAITAGGAIGFFQVYRADIRVDGELQRIQVPGSWSNLVIMLLIFSSRYYFGYDLAVNPQHQELLDYQIIKFASSGVLTGFLQGKLLGYLYHIKKAEKSSLQAL